MKALPVEFLRSLSVSELTYLGKPALHVPYLDRDGNEVAVRFRIAVAGDDRFRWRKRSKPCLYGLNRLGQAKRDGYLVLVEGESDAQTAWYHELPALGLPGANGWREDRDASLLEGIEKIYVVVEPDAGGEAVLNWLRRSQIRERVLLVRLGEVKDLSALYLRDPEQFRERVATALAAAVPWEQEELVALELRRRDAGAACEPLAREPRILDLLAEAVRLRGHVGEERLVKLLYLIATSRLLDQIVSAVVKGPSAAGKSRAVRAVLDFIPAEAILAFTAMSPRALVFDEEDLRHRMLVLYEAEGLQEGTHAYLVRSLLSEGRLDYLVTEEDGSGRFGARHVEREGPTGLIVTTTLTQLHPEIETRLLSLSVDDRPEQTRRVLLALAQPAPADAVDLAPWLALQEWLASGPAQVEIPFASRLAQLVPPAAVRLRRDFGAVLALICAHALLQQANRPRTLEGAIVATLEDYTVVRELVADLVSDGIGATVPASVRETVEAVRELGAAEGAGAGVSVAALSTQLGIDKSAGSRRWRDARDRGYLRNEEERRGRPARIMLDEPLPDKQPILPSPEALAGVEPLHARRNGTPAPPNHYDKKGSLMLAPFLHPDPDQPGLTPDKRAALRLRNAATTSGYCSVVVELPDEEARAA